MQNYIKLTQRLHPLRYVIPQPVPPLALAYIWRPDLFVRLLKSRGMHIPTKYSIFGFRCRSPSGNGPPNLKPHFN